MYEQIGNNLRECTNKNVLDVGFEVFNIYNYSYFNNYDINYYQIDIRYNEEYIKKIPFGKFIFQDLLSYDKFDFYNVVISFGVLGYIEFTPEQIDNYLMQIYKLLISDGIFYLKIDNKHMGKTFDKNNIVNNTQIYKYFKNYKDQFTIGNNEFTFYVLEKNVSI